MARFKRNTACWQQKFTLREKNAFIEQEEWWIYGLPRAWLCGRGTCYPGLLRFYFETLLFLQQNLNVQFWKRSSSTCWHVKSPSCLKLTALLLIWAQHESRVTYEHDQCCLFSLVLFSVQTLQRTPACWSVLVVTSERGHMWTWAATAKPTLPPTSIRIINPDLLML